MFAKRWTLMGMFVLASACSTGVPESEIAAKVNGEAITKTEFQEQVDRNMARYQGQSQQLPPSIEVRIKESVLRRMIDDKMIAQKAKELSVEVTQADLDAKFQEYKSRFRTDQAFQDYLKRSKNTEANMVDDLKRNMLRDRVVEKMSGSMEVTPEEVAKYFEENKQRFVEREQIKASRILLRIPPNAKDAEKKALKAKAEGLRKKAAAPNADFAVLAKDNSNDPQASRGGDLGWFARGRMPPEFDNVAFTLQPNAVSPVVETKMGFEIIKVWEKRPERERPLDEVKENIQNSLLARKRNEKRREILRDLKANAKIETLLKFEEPPAPNGPAVAGPGAPGAPGGAEVPGAFQLKPPTLPRHNPAMPPGAGMPEGSPEPGSMPPPGNPTAEPGAANP